MPRPTHLTPIRRDLLIRVAAHRDEIPQRLSAIAADAGMTLSNAHHHLAVLVAAGFVAHRFRGGYEATDKGVEACVAKRPSLPGGKARQVAKCPCCGHRLYVS